jgi:tetratricopeptide (TPR) repeat protein
MIERLLAAQRALDSGQLEMARIIFGQVAEADPRSAIAVVGLADVARRQGDLEEARRLVDQALAIDPEDATALRMAGELASAASAALATGSAETGVGPTEPEGAMAAGARSDAVEEAVQPQLGRRRSPLDWLRRLFGRGR